MRRAAAIVVAMMIPAQAWAITANPGSDYEVEAEGSITLDAGGTFVSFECGLDQLIYPNPPAFGVEFRWDLDGNGTWDVGWTSDSTVVFDASGYDGPTVHTAALEVRCWTNTGAFGIPGSWVAETDTTDVPIDILNVAPVLGAMTAPGRDLSALPPGQAVDFEVEVDDVEPADLPPDSVTWTWPDGEITTGVATTKTFTASGAGSVQVVADDGDGGTDTETYTFVVTDPPPVIDALDVPATADEGSDVALSVTASDPVDALDITWTFTDGTVLVGSDVVLPGRDDGLVGVTVEVDDGTQAVSESRDLDILEVAPTLSELVALDAVVEGALVDFRATATDPFDAIVSTELSSTGSDQGLASGAGKEASLSWPDDGPVTVTSRVFDADGSVSDPLVRSFTVLNADPVLVDVSVPASADEAAPVAHQATATDVPADTLTYTWQLGDGTVLDGTNVSHAYAEGTWPWTLTVTDEDGGVATSSGTVVVDNQAPSIDQIALPQALVEGSPGTFTATATDPAGDPLTFTWDFGDGQVATGDTVDHTYAGDGVYTVVLTVSDGTTQVSDSATLTVSNADPQILSPSLPSSADEGEAVDFSVDVVDPGDDPVTVTWFVNGFEEGAGTSFTRTFDDDGVFQVRVRAEDDGGGVSQLIQQVTVANVAPTVTVEGETDDTEGPTLSWTSVVVEPGADTLTYDWDFGDGTTALDAGPTASHTYTANGPFTVTLTVTDDDGGVGTGTLDVSISELGPDITVLALPGTVDEGAPADLACEGEDGANTGVLDASWDLGDGTLTTGTPVTHTWADDGAFTVSCTLTDGDGATDTQSGTVQVDNVAPTITSTPPGVIAETQTLTYDATADDPGADTLAWSGELPSGATLDPVTGVLSWTPAAGAFGPVSLELTVDDGDGGTGVQTFSVEVVMLDEDGDFMSDPWEVGFGLDPTDPSDAGFDPDGDGRTNLDEYVGETDPTQSDAPGAPPLISPDDGAEVADARPFLEVGPAPGVPGESRWFDVHVYADAQLTQLVDEIVDVPEGPAGITVRPALLAENTSYWWTARAHDGYIAGPWAPARSFFVNAIEEPPLAPALAWPPDGSTVSVLDPVLEVAATTDPDGDDLTYDVFLDTSTGSPLGEGLDLSSVGGVASWAVDPALVDGQVACWYAIARDEHGLDSLPSETWCFEVDTSNLPPSEPGWVRPGDRTVVTTATPVVQVDNGLDPEGRATYHRFEVDADVSFGTDALQAAEVDTDPSGATSWIPEPLGEDQVWHLRVLASDFATQSAWVGGEVFVNADNAPALAPTVAEPEAEGVLRPGESVALLQTSDPDASPYSPGLTYTIEIQRRADGVVVARSDTLGLGADDRVRWTPPTLEAGEYAVVAWAVDELGLEGERSAPHPFGVVTDDEIPNSRVLPEASDEALEILATGCGCGTHTPRGAAGAVLLVVLAGLRRRRERR